MLAFYTKQEFGRSTSVAVHDEGSNAIRVIQTLNGRVTSDRRREFADDAERNAYLAELDQRLTGNGLRGQR